MDALHVFTPDIASWRRQRTPTLPGSFPITLGTTTVPVAGPGERVRAEPFEAVVIRTDEGFGLV